MADAPYAYGIQQIMEGKVNLLTDDIKVALVDLGTYTYDSAHENFGQITGVETSASLTSKTTDQPTAGVFDADNVTLTPVSAGLTSMALILYKDTGTQNTSPLLAYIDSATGLDVTTDGSDVVVTWDTGANRIFSIG